jgi:hypothetical protein
MKIKWNWGTKLLIGMIVFMLFLIVFFVLMTNQTYHLVEKDYYPKALEYQQRIDKMDNTNKLENQILVKNQGEYLIFTFPSVFESNRVAGKIVLYRPSDGTMDISMKIRLDSLNQHIFPVMDIQKGKYIAKIDYSESNNGYYQEIPVFVKMFSK